MWRTGMRWLLALAFLAAMAARGLAYDHTLPPASSGPTVKCDWCAYW